MKHLATTQDSGRIHWRPQVQCVLPEGASAALRAYFYSGWGFFIPYLALYLLYYWQKWPANPVSGLPVDGGPLRVTGHGSPSAVAWIPPLLYVYWALHAIHAVLAAIALRSWWHAAAQRLSNIECPRASGESPSVIHDAAPPRPFTAHCPPYTVFWAALRTITPWALLALIFYIPGVYLEWPADPWEHLRRITEWQVQPLVGFHSAGYKSFYFFAYSWVGWLSPGYLLSWLNLYYVSICLLLAWQFYLLAKAVGLDGRWAFLFVTVNVLTFGNSCFSFYRYYGISTSVFAQLGAVALTRITLDYVKSIRRRAGPEWESVGGQTPEPSTVDRAANPRPNHRKRAQLSLRRFFSLPSKSRRQQSTVDCSPAISSLSTVRRVPPPPTSSQQLSTTVQPPLTVYSLLFTSLCLITLIVFNHIQGVGIAGLCVGAIVIWRLVEWRHSMIFWLSTAAILLSIATALWWPRHPNIDAVFRRYGWLNAWYGLDLLSPHSPASARMMQMLGVFGLINIIGGIVLLRRNHIAAWLTVVPAAALSLPIAAIPLANTLTANTIGMYHRMFLAIPWGLALICCVRQWKPRQRAPLSSLVLARSLGGFVALAFVIVLMPEAAQQNRFWQTLAVSPDDLRMRSLEPAEIAVAGQWRDYKPFRLITTKACGFVFNAFEPQRFASSHRVIWYDPLIENQTHELVDLVELARSARSPLHRELPQLQLARDPTAADATGWKVTEGAQPEFVSIKDFCDGSTALQNPLGQASHVFTAKLIPIDPTRRYRIEASVRQRAGTTAVAYLAVSWHDENGHLLQSADPPPAGGGRPIGWGVGTYSYFGLIRSQVPPDWTTYRKSFGASEGAAIPAHARFIRLGALLNYDRDPGAVIQLANFRLWIKAPGEIAADGIFLCNEHNLTAVRSTWLLSSYASQAAQASRHWQAQQVSSDFAASAELEAAARNAGTSEITLATGVLGFRANTNAPASPAFQ